MYYNVLQGGEEMTRKQISVRVENNLLSDFAEAYKEYLADKHIPATDLNITKIIELALLSGTEYYREKTSDLYSQDNDF